VPPWKTFNNAKQVTFDVLDTCPVDVIQQFMNRSWWFMSAYHIKLTGKVAVWAVCKQKSQRSISQTAMMHLDAIVNP